MMNQDPHVQACVMFGRGQFQAGILVEPKPEYSFDPSDETKIAEFRNTIWYVAKVIGRRRWLTNGFRPTIMKMNTFAPQHSRLFKEVSLTGRSRHE